MIFDLYIEMDFSSKKKNYDVLSFFENESYKEVYAIEKKN